MVHEPGFQDKTASDVEVQEPRSFRVLLHNDDYTTMEFVVQVLETVFHKTPLEAARIMMNVHRAGIGECGVYVSQVAETKVAMVRHLAREHGFPLKCSMEEV